MSAATVRSRRTPLPKGSRRWPLAGNVVGVELDGLEGRESKLYVGSITREPGFEDGQVVVILPRHNRGTRARRGLIRLAQTMATEDLGDEVLWHGYIVTPGTEHDLHLAAKFDLAAWRGGQAAS